MYNKEHHVVPKHILASKVPSRYSKANDGEDQRSLHWTMYMAYETTFEKSLQCEVVTDWPCSSL